MVTMNLEQARFNMVEQQVRPWEVLDQRVLSLMQSLSRNDFVPEQYRNLAFADTGIPLGHGEFMLEPRIEGRILQAVNVQKEDKVLEIGTGSGYLTALLAKLAKHVISIDIVSDFTKQAGAALKTAGIDNVTLKTGDAINGWEEDAPYDVIVAGASVDAVPTAYKEQLKDGGRLFIVSGSAPIMQARLITRKSRQEWVDEVLFETEIPVLRGANSARVFEF